MTDVIAYVVFGANSQSTDAWINNAIQFSVALVAEDGSSFGVINSSEADGHGGVIIPPVVFGFNERKHSVIVKVTTAVETGFSNFLALNSLTGYALTDVRFVLDSM